MLRDQLLKTRGLPFDNWLFGPKSLWGLSRFRFSVPLGARVVEKLTTNFDHVSFSLLPLESFFFCFRWRRTFVYQPLRFITNNKKINSKKGVYLMMKGKLTERRYVETQQSFTRGMSSYTHSYNILHHLN